MGIIRGDAVTLTGSFVTSSWRTGQSKGNEIFLIGLSKERSWKSRYDILDGRDLKLPTIQGITASAAPELPSYRRDTGEHDSSPFAESSSCLVVVGVIVVVVVVVVKVVLVILVV